MATITGYTAEYMETIRDSVVVDGNIVGDDLILTNFGGDDINAGNVRGPMGPPGDIPVGGIIDWIHTVAPENWLLIDGSTVINGQTLYADLWPLLPASWKSGANIILGSAKGKVSVGYDSGQTEFDTIGETGGSKTHTLTQAELPAASITIDPPNTSVTITDPTHNHSQNVHTHVQNAHTHLQDLHTHQTIPSGYSWIVQGGTGSSGVQAAPGPFILSYGNFTEYVAAINQDTTPTNQNTTATNNAASTGITASVNIAAFNSGNLGSGSAHNNLQPYITFSKIIRAA